MVKFFTGTPTDRRLALLLFAGTFGLYLRTVAPGLLFGDAGEFQVAAWTRGLAHPTGYPLYLLLGSLWQHLLALFGLSPAHALNIMSAFFGALTVSLLYLLLMDWLQSVSAVRRLVALFGALLLAVNPTFWSQSLIAEVYTLHALFLLLILHTCYRLMMSTRPQHTVEASTADQSHAAPFVFILALLVSFSFTHHAMTLLLLPSIVLALWWSRRRWSLTTRQWLLLLIVFFAPLLLYLYIPLRSGPGPSPWYHQTLGTAPLHLFQNNWSSFWTFVSGQSISVGFRDASGALAQLPQAWLLWQLHFYLPGLVLVGLGLYALTRAHNWQVLALTVPFFLLQQGFNLFYNIGDILVYYIPLYLIGVIWAAFAVDAVGGSMANIERTITEQEQATDEQERAEPSGDWRQKSRAKEKRPQALAISTVLVLTLFWLPFQLGHDYFPQLDQSDATGARAMWEPLVSATPADAILISNDRNEIVPLFYYQAVEQRLTEVTGLFPLIEPSDRFADIGATVTTALENAGERPVFLIKAMPGLEVRFDLQTTASPLVTVEKPTTAPAGPQLDLSFGPLTLLGVDQQSTAEALQITLYWQVNQSLSHDYTTTVQLFDKQGEKLAQDDLQPGGRYYPTSLWKAGEVLVEKHQLPVAEVPTDATLLIKLYDSSTMEPLAPPLQMPIPSP